MFGHRWNCRLSQAAAGILCAGAITVAQGIPIAHAREAGMTGYWDPNQQTRYVFYVDWVGDLIALSQVNQGAGWVETDLAAASPTQGGYVWEEDPFTSYDDGSNGHFFFRGPPDQYPYSLGELVGSPPTPNGLNLIVSYGVTMQPHSSFFDGQSGHVFFEAASSSGGSARTLHEAYFTGAWYDNSALPQCSYSGGVSNETAYWDGVEHVVFNCTNDSDPSNPVVELWETYFDGSWWTHPIATNASGGVAPVGKVAGGSLNGVEGIIGPGLAPNTIVYTQYASGIWSSTSIPVPSVASDSQFLVYPDSSGLNFFFVGADFHVYTVIGPGSANKVVDLTGPLGWNAGGYYNVYGNYWLSELTGYFDGVNDMVFFTGVDGNIWELSDAPNDSNASGWVYQAITSDGAAYYPY